MLSLTPTARAADGDDFSLAFRGYTWLAGIDGDVGARGVTASVDESFMDIVDASDSMVGFFGRVDVRKGRFGVYADGGFMRLGVENIQTRLGPANDTFDLALLDLALTYRLIDTQRTDAGPGMAVYGLAGARYMHLQNEFDFDVLASRKQTRDWVDPIVGAEAVLDMTEHWRFLVHGDIGGFGASADLTWSAFALIGYRFDLWGKNAEVLAGYKALGEDYTTGSGTDEFTWDTVMHGPLVAFNIIW